MDHHASECVHASRGMFTFQDHNTPWGIVARNLDVTVARPGSEYVGQARFSDGLTTIQGYVPFRTDMTRPSRSKAGACSSIASTSRPRASSRSSTATSTCRTWPELMLQVKSTIDLPRMRELFFRRHVHAERQESVHRHVSSVQGADAQRDNPNGRELKGTFLSTTAGVNDFRFQRSSGTVRWTPEVLRDQ